MEEMQMITVLIRSELRDDADMVAFDGLDVQMLERVASVAGFVDAATWVGSGGGTVSVYRFINHEALAAWRDDPAHLTAQERGRREFYRSYEVEVLERVRHYRYQDDEGRRELTGTLGPVG
jgi:heme-degrading monooxygenase HmoA